MPELLSYDVSHPVLRSPQQEWQPHAKQNEKSIEWWYVTTIVHDASGNPYFLVWCLFNFLGEAYHPPGIKVPAGHRFARVLGGFTDYRSDWHIGFAPNGILKEEHIWNAAQNALRFETPDCTFDWSLGDGTMDMHVVSQPLSFDLRMSGTQQVMWAKDKLGIEGFIQEGAEDDRSFYYSLPRLLLTGRIAFLDAMGVRREIDVTGQAWVDRQWGDFLTKSWEWSSLRFDNGARVNLYNFGNGHQIGTYQKANGSTQWFDRFVVRQNGYVKCPENGVWMSWGWSYEFPMEVEGSRNFTLRPFSKKDIYVSKINTLFEGPATLIDDTSGKQVGSAVAESMDVRIMNNFPYGPQQR